jgi:hypothetical protein
MTKATRGFDSNEERYFSWYLDELKKSGFVTKWSLIPDEDSYPLTDGLSVEYIVPMKKVDDKIKVQSILKPSVYTPDFKIIWTIRAYGTFVTELDDPMRRDKITTPFISQDGESIVETKGTFDKNNMTRLANNNIKFVFERHGIFINMIKVPGIFNKTFTPERYFLTDKTLTPRKISYKRKWYLSDFIESCIGL